MKQILFAALIVMGFVACNDNNDGANQEATTTDSTYSNPIATDTAISDSSGIKAGAGQGTGSGVLSSQDTGTRRP